MKLLLLSPYNNAELRSHLVLKDYCGFVNFVIKRLGLSRKVNSLKDTAPWVGNLIAELEKRSDIEIISVSPQIKLKNRIESFKLNRTTYYFYSSDFSSALRLLKNYRLWKLFQNCGRRVKRIVKEVQPDVIVLFGTENPIISAPILYLTDYPVFCILQTVYNNPERGKYVKPNKMKQQLELDILHHVHNFGMGNPAYRDLLLNLNPNVNAIKYLWPTNRFPYIHNQTKRYDFVNFAFSMDSRKGDEDSIRALAIVKKKYPDVTLNITGGLSLERKRHLERLLDELGLKENVSFTPFFERHEDMLKHVMQSRFAVLPIKLDLISTTVKEAMFYKLPVVTNRTKGTPNLNKERQCVLLAEIENIDSLAECMLELMENCHFAELLKHNAYNHLLHQLQNNTQRIDNFVNIMKAIYDNKYSQTPIPQNFFL